MLYVQQSLGPDEEILFAGQFHWMYTVQAVIWILAGIAAAIGIICVAVWFEINKQLETIPSDHPQYDEYWDHVVNNTYGGYMNIVWGLNPAIRFGALGIFVFGLLQFATMMLNKATTEIAVTTERLIYKKGFIARQAGELSIDRIEGVNVLQGILGRIFRYGRVSVRGMGVGEVLLPPIAFPIEFRKAIQESRGS